MRRITLFLILTIASLASLVATVIAGYYVLTASANQPSTFGNVWDGMMGGMMGGYTGAQAQTASSVAPVFGIAFVILAGVAVVGIGGLIYFFAFPEIKTQPQFSQPLLKAGAFDGSAAAAGNVAETEGSPYSSVVKTLTPNERKVLEVLNAHNGKYLQKYIRNEAALSRLQTHRIVARLAERGIVSLEKTGNTNNVLLANWLK